MAEAKEDVAEKNPLLFKLNESTGKNQQ